MLKTTICDLFGIRYPIIQGGMTYLANPELVAAVSNAGALGFLGTGNAPPDWVREQVYLTRALTDSPFGINIMVGSTFADELVEVAIE